MNKQLIPTLVFGAILSIFSGWAVTTPEQPPTGKKVLTLSDCLQRIRSISPALRAVRLDVETYERRARALRASYLPVLTANAQGGYLAGNPTSFFTVNGATEPEIQRNEIPSVGSYRSGGANLTVPLIRDGSIFGLNDPPAARIKRADAQISKYGEISTEQQELYAVTRNYLDILSSQNKLILLKRLTEVSKLQYDLAATKFSAGIITQQDLDTARENWQQNLISSQTASDLAVESFLRLTLMLNISDPEAYTLQMEYPTMPKIPAYSEMVKFLNSHPDVLQQEATIDKAKSQLALDQGKIWPVVGLSGNYTYADDAHRIEPKNGSAIWTSFLTVNAPVFDFGSLHQNARGSLASVDAESQRLSVAKENVRQRLYDAYSNIRDNTYQAASLNSRVAKALTQFKKSQVLSNSGAVTTTLAYQNEQDYINIRLQQEDTTVSHILSFAQLQIAVAGKWSWYTGPTSPTK
jgi:outer membrane protein TolC